MTTTVLLLYLIACHAILSQVVAQVDLKCNGDDVFLHRNGSCQSCQSLTCSKGYEPNQRCGNGKPLDGDACVQCDPSNTFSEAGEKCLRCSICVERVVAVSCNGVNDTVCGGCNKGYFSSGKKCVRCSLHPEPQHLEECFPSGVNGFKGVNSTESGHLASTIRKRNTKNGTGPVIIYIMLPLMIILLVLVFILIYLAIKRYCSCCHCKSVEDQQQNNQGGDLNRSVDQILLPVEEVVAVNNSGSNRNSGDNPSENQMLLQNQSDIEIVADNSDLNHNRLSPQNHQDQIPNSRNSPEAPAQINNMSEQDLPAEIKNGQSASIIMIERVEHLHVNSATGSVQNNPAQQHEKPPPYAFYHSEEQNNTERADGERRAFNPHY